MKDESKLRSEYVFENPRPDNPDADPLPTRRLPQAGEDLAGRRMSSLPSLPEDFNKSAMAGAVKAGQVASHDDSEEAEPDLAEVMGLPVVYDGSHLHDHAFGPATPTSAMDEWKSKSGGAR